MRGKIVKNNYKYLKKMDQADELIKVAKEINLTMLEKNKYKLEQIHAKKHARNKTVQPAETVALEPAVFEKI
jgi:hypothetical protein